MTREAFENAITIVAATGGSTNAALHLPALAHECDVKLSLDDIDRISRRTPIIADLKPFGRYTALDWLGIYAEHSHEHADQIRRARRGED